MSAGRKVGGARPALRRIVRWYLRTQVARPGVPFYCDPARVGAFAVAPGDLAAGSDDALFRVLITLSMYQALRDVVIMRQQRSLGPRAMRVVADARAVGRAITKHPCGAFHSAEAFEVACDVSKSGDVVDCCKCPGARCHVKDATIIFRRMGDMGKLPTSAWLQLWKGGGISAVVADVCRSEVSPVARAELLVARLAMIHRVGRKLATLFVSALSTPTLAPGLTPWFPRIDGNWLVVVDTNVARAVDVLRGAGASRTYESRARWVRTEASRIDLREFGRDLPSYSPRFVQEALYAFCSKSNRAARRDACADRTTACSKCVPGLCPFARPGAAGARLR